MTHNDLTERMIAYVQCLLCYCERLKPETQARIERLETYLIRRFNRDWLAITEK